MVDQNEWMEKYINKRRMKFLNHMKTLVLSQGFPGIHDSIRDRITRYFNQEGFFRANIELLDQILRADNFPQHFIEVCEREDCNPELVRIMREGLQEYEHKHPRRPQARQNHNQDSKKSEGYTARLLNELKNIRLIENPESVGGAECRPDTDMTDNNFGTEKILVDECMMAGLICAGSGEVVRSIPGVDSSPSPSNSNINSERHSNPSNVNVSESGGKVEDSGSEIENYMQITQPPMYGKETDPGPLPGKRLSPDRIDNNMNKMDQFKRASNENKMDAKALQQTECGSSALVNSSRNNDNSDEIGNLTKNLEEIANRRDGFDERRSERQGAAYAQNAGPPKSRNSLYKSAQHENSVSTESVGSYYLTSSDEEDLEPPENNGVLQMTLQNNKVLQTEDLKESVSSDYNLEIHKERFVNTETANENMQNTKDKQILTASEISEAKFLVVSSDLSGIQCQEDINNKKVNEVYTEERLDFNTFHDVRETSERIRPWTTLDNTKKVSNKESKAGECTYELTSSSPNDIDTEKSKTTYQEQADLDTYPNVSSLLTDHTLSQTDLNEVTNIIETDPDQTLCKIVNCSPVDLITTNIANEDAFDSGKKIFKDKGSHSSGQISACSNTSEGSVLNTCTDSLAFPEKDNVNSSLVSASESPSNHNLDAYPFEQSLNLLECKGDTLVVDTSGTNAVAVINQLTFQDLTIASGPQINTLSPIHPEDAQMEISGQNISLVETNQEVGESNQIAESDTNIGTNLNYPKPSTRSFLLGNFYTFMRNVVSNYFPELNLRW